MTFDPTTLPPNGLWVSPTSVCCDEHVDLDGTPAPAVGPCPDPTDTDLAWLATRLLSARFGDVFPGYHTAVDEIILRTRGGSRLFHQPASSFPQRQSLQIGDGRWPVVWVNSVTVDGTLLAAAAWRLDTSGMLVRIDGDPWPTSRPIVVSYIEGAIPSGGSEAALRLLCVLRRQAARDRVKPMNETPVAGPASQIISYSYSGLSATVAEDQADLGVLGWDPIVLAFVRSIPEKIPTPCAVFHIDPLVRRRTFRQINP